MYICTYTHISTCVFVHMYTHTYEYMYTCIHIHMYMSCLLGQVRFWGVVFSRPSGIEFGRSRPGEGSSGKRGVVRGVGQERLGPSYGRYLP